MIYSDICLFCSIVILLKKLTRTVKTSQPLKKALQKYENLMGNSSYKK